MPANLKHAFRSLRKHPGFSVMAILTLALGIGANTAVFSVVHGVMLRDLPFRDPGQLVHIRPATRVPVYTKARFLFLREHNTSYLDLGARGGGRGAVLLGQGDARAITTSSVTANLLPLMGVTPVIGRGFDPDDATSGEGVVAISQQLWETAFNADPTIVGRTLSLDTRGGRTTHTVVGVLPPSLQLIHSARADIWFPIDLTADLNAMQVGVQLIGRLRPDVTVEQAQQEFASLTLALKETNPALPQNFRLSGAVIPLDEWVLGNKGELLWLLLGSSGFVLLIACANVANLFLVRSTQRRREFAVRTALGAGRAKISGLVLTESLLVAIAGGLLGIALAAWAHDLMLAGFPVDLPRRDEIGLNGTVLAVALVLSAGAACVFALVPSLGLQRHNLRDVMSSGGGRSGTSRRSHRLQRTIITAEIALALVLTLGTGLMVRTVQALRRQESGIQSTNVVALTLQVQYQDTERLHSFFDQLLERTDAVPGIASTALTYHVPLSGSSTITTVRLPDHPSVPPNETQTVGFQIVSPDYFRTMGIPLIRGETFSPRPVEAESQIIVSEAFARQYWPDENPLGKAVTGSGQRRVVGVVGDTRHRGLQLAPRPEAYYPVSSFHRGDMSLVARSAIPVEAVTRAVSAEVTALDANVPITDVQSMDQVIDASLATERRTLRLLGMFALLALALGAIGVYGVIAYAVSQQRREFGIRLALGARGQGVIRMVILWGLKHAVVGVTTGAVLSLALTRAMQSQLFGVSSTDGATLAAAAVVLTLVATAATAIPAVRAARIQPMEVLRQE